MTIKEQINADFMTAFKAGAEGRDKKNFLSVLKGDIQLAESKEGYNGEETVLGIVNKMKKSLESFTTEDSERELSYLEPYLPQLMSEVEIREAVQLIIINTGEKNMGKVMGSFNVEYKGKADNKIVSRIVKEELV